METEGEIAVGLRSDGVVDELGKHPFSGAVRARLQEQTLLDRPGCHDPLLNPKGSARIPTNHIESLQILKTIERSGEQRVGAAAWPFLLSLRAMHPMVTVPTMFHGRVAVLPVVAIVAAIQEGQFGFNFSRCLLRDSK
jgi:hypothetical protein